jgi:hypothetical protein
MSDAELDRIAMERGEDADDETRLKMWAAKRAWNARGGKG